MEEEKVMMRLAEHVWLLLALAAIFGLALLIARAANREASRFIEEQRELSRRHREEITRRARWPS
jgi:hypothetical protein